MTAPVNPAYSPRWAPASASKRAPTAPMLHLGRDPVPRQCSECGSHLLSLDPDMGLSRTQTLTCAGCGVVLAELVLGRGR